MRETQKKKILYVITKSNFGGAQRYVYELATNLDRAQYEVHVACGGNGVLVEKLKDAGITVHLIASFERDINLTKELSSLRELYALIRALTPDIVHLNSSKAGGTGALIARMCGVPNIIFTAHGWPFFEKRNPLALGIIWLLSYLTVRFAHRTIVVSKHDLDHAHMPFLHKKLVHIPLGIPLIDFEDRNTARTHLFSPDVIQAHHDDLWMVSTGEFTHNKNLSFLLRGIHTHNKTHEKKIFLALIGTGELETKLKEEVAERELTNAVSFLGYIENARTYLHAFDVFAIPSHKEGLPYGLLEAGSAGLYCIGSRVGGIPEIVGENTNSVLIDPTDDTSLSCALTYVTACLDTQEENKILSEYIQSVYGIDQMVAKTKALYETHSI